MEVKRNKNISAINNKNPEFCKPKNKNNSINPHNTNQQNNYNNLKSVNRIKEENTNNKKIVRTKYSKLNIK
jgi:hypothetical protein